MENLYEELLLLKVNYGIEITILLLLIIFIILIILCLTVMKKMKDK